MVTTAMASRVVSKTLITSRVFFSRLDLSSSTNQGRLTKQLIQRQHRPKTHNKMPSTFPCATCGAPLNGSSFEYQKHMTKCHWSGKNNSFPLPSIFTTSAANSIQNTPSTTTNVLNWLDMIPTSAYADFTFAPAYLWPSLQPANPTTEHYSPFYTNAAWVQAKSNTSADPFCSSAPKNTWPPRPLTSSPDSEVSPCERTFAAKFSTASPPSKKRKRCVDDCGLERPAQRLRLDTSSTGMSAVPSENVTPQVADFLASVGVTPHSGKRVYLRPVRPSGL
jgi:hypothetical protein